jgi:hypothetical protein
MFGIGCLISGCNISIDQLHLDYTSNETAKILQNRLDKNSILTVDEYNDIFADTFRKNKDNLEEIFKMLQ